MSKYKAIEDFLSLQTCTEVTDFAITEGKWSFKAKGSLNDYMVSQVTSEVPTFKCKYNGGTFTGKFSDYLFDCVKELLMCIDSEVTVDYPELNFTDCRINEGLISFIDNTGRSYVQSKVNNELFEHLGSTAGFYWVLSNSNVEQIKNRINESSVLRKVSKELIDFDSNCSDIKGYLKVIEEGTKSLVDFYNSKYDIPSLIKDIQEIRETTTSNSPSTQSSNFKGTQFNSESLMKYAPTNGVQCPYPSNPSDYRGYHGKAAWLYNPYTGDIRTAEDVGNDVFGYLIKPVC